MRPRSRHALPTGAALIAVAVGFAAWIAPSQTPAQDEIVPVPDLTGEFPGTRGEEDDWFGYESPLQFGFQGGSTYVNPDWLFTVEHFRPIGNRKIGSDELVTYVDARFGLGKERRAANFGTGVRHYSKLMNTIADVNFWYDYDWTDTNRFNQFTFGGQVQNEWLTARLHIYEPLGDDIKTARFSATDSTPVFVAQQLSFSRFRVDELAYEGFDAEVGGILTTPWTESRLYCGIYHFESDSAEHELDGVSARVEQQVGSNCIASLGVTNDDVTDTSVMFRLTWEIGGVPRGYFGDTIKHRLAEAPRRNYNMVLLEQTTLDPLIATSAASGNTINVIHASSLVGGAGNGSFTQPFTSLADAAASAAGTAGEDIILAHAGSVFDGQGIMLPDDTRFLGDGIDHTVETAEFGVVTLPRANGQTTRPIIRNAPSAAAAVQLASGVELNNINVEMAQGDGVLANAVSGSVLVRNVSVDGATDGLSVRNSLSTADFTFDSLSVANTMDQGIELANNDSGATIAFTGVTQIDSTADAAFRIGGGGATVGVGALQITNYSNRAVDLFQSGGPVTFSSPLILSNTMASLSETIRIQQSDGVVTFGNVTIDDTSSGMGAGASPTVNLLSNRGTVNFNSLVVNSANRIALLANNGSGVTDTLRIDSGTLSSTNATAISLQNLSRMSITLQRVSASNTTNGIEIFNSGDVASNDVFRIVGTGTGSGDGGSITGVDVGVNLQNSADIFLNFLDITSSVAGIQVTDSDDISINANQLQGTNDNWIGIDLNSGFGFGIGGQNVVTNNLITGNTGSNQFGIDLRTDRSFPVEITFGGNNIALSGSASTGINLLAVGNASATGTAGDIELSSTGNNNPAAAMVPFTFDEQNGASINGQILINGVAQPPGP